MSECVSELEILLYKLHSKRMHPDYEYATTIHIYATGYRSQLLGSGWEINTEYEGGSKDDSVRNIQHWRRLKELARADDVSLWDAPEHQIPKMRLSQYVGILQRCVDVRYFNKSVKVGDNNPKPHMVDSNAVLSVSNGGGFYECVSLKNASSSGDAVICCDVTYLALHLPEGIIHSKKENTLPGIRRTSVAVSLADVQLLSNLKKPLEETYVRAKRHDGVWMPWQAWRAMSALALNHYQVEKALNEICV